MYWERDGDDRGRYKDRDRDRDKLRDGQIEIDILVNKIKWMEQFLNKYKFNINIKVHSLLGTFTHANLTLLKTWEVGIFCSID